MKANLKSGALLLCGLIVSGVNMGCGSNGPQRAAVSGTVTVDGATLEEGVISFLPMGETKGPTSGARIIGGKYTIPAVSGPVLGMHRVEITARRKARQTLPIGKASSDAGTESSASEETLNQFIPPNYNSKSTLTFDVKAGKNEFDIPLQLTQGSLAGK